MHFAVGTGHPAFLLVVPLGLGFHNGVDLKILALLGGLCGALPFAGIAGYAHHAMFGNFWTTGYSYLENKSNNYSQDFWHYNFTSMSCKCTHLTEVGLIFFSPLVDPALGVRNRGATHNDGWLPFLFL